MQSGAQITLERRSVDLLQLVDDTVTDHQQQTGRHRISIETGEGAIVGSWDPARLRRVVSNLLDNAIKYSPDGGDIVVRAYRDPQAPDSAIVEVQDHGVGIPATDLPRIFEQFRRGSNVMGRISGTGIGLNASQQIIGLHGGIIHVDSREDMGSTFTIRLPIEGK